MSSAAQMSWRAVAGMLFLAAAVSGCSDGVTRPADRNGPPQLSVVRTGRPLAVGDAIPGEFLVQLADTISDSEIGQRAHAMAGALHGSVLHVYHLVHGFAVKLPQPAAEALLRNDPRVSAVEPNRVISAGTIETSAPWGLDRIDQRSLPFNGQYRYSSDGTGVTIYIIDSGIRISHADFGGRASVGYDALGGSGLDCNGHGTHVAGIAGGTTYGVAKGASLVSVRVLGCDNRGTWDDLVEGLDWVSAHHVNPAVANISIWGTASDIVDAAVRNLIANGVSVVVIAGNDGQSSDPSACSDSPARVAEAITVAATTSADARASFSSYGPCVDLFAPGQDILSDYNGSDTDIALMSGTSMAAPHVAGVVALLRQRHPGDAPARLADSVTGEATLGVVTNKGTGSPNRLLFSSPPPPFSVSIMGPTSISTEGTYTWSATESHGVAPITYAWEIAYDNLGGQFGSLGTGTSVGFGVMGADGSFTLRLTGHSADGQIAVVTRHVTNLAGTGGGGGGCGRFVCN